MEVHILETVILCLLLPAVVIDFKSFRLPLLCTLPAGMISIIGFTWFMGWSSFLAGLAGFVCIISVRIISRMFGKSSLGFGDALLMLSLGPAVGLLGLYWTFLLSAASALSYGLYSKRLKVPFGPFLLLGAVMTRVGVHFYAVMEFTYG